MSLGWAVAFAGAAAAGAVVRWRVALVLPRPVGTFVVNVTGALALGLLEGRTGPAVTVVAAGGLGALTTFSSLAVELVDLGRRRPVWAAAYAAATLVVGIAAAALGSAWSAR